MDFKIGDAVKLKEGFSPTMMVSDIEGDLVTCEWYSDKEGKFIFKSLHKDILKHYTKKGLLDKS